MQNKENRGFTLLELLIVIAIIAILAVVIIIVLDPAETLKKSRDSQRMSDLSTVKTALGIYTTSTTSPLLGSATTNTACRTATGATPGAWAASDSIFYSLPSGTDITDTTLDDSTGADQPAAVQVASTASGNTDGTGWIPVALDSLTSGSPISNFPIDPVNTVAAVGAVVKTDLVYRYACTTTLQYEIDAQLESTAYTSTDDKRAKDGGTSTTLYEVGTNLKILEQDGSATNEF